MRITMQKAESLTREQMREFLAASEELDFALARQARLGRAGVYQRERHSVSSFRLACCIFRAHAVSPIRRACCSSIVALMPVWQNVCRIGAP